MATDPIGQDDGQDAESAHGAGGATSVVTDPVVADLVVDRERWGDCAFDEVAASWHRSAENHRIDPASMVAPHVLTTAELRESREPIDAMVRAAQSELDRVYGIVRRAGYVVLFCDANGVAVDYRGDEGRSAQFRHWGVWVGGSWSEAMEGTNGIGTCIAEQRPITVHQTQHFRARHGSLSCSGAPVFGADARLTAVLDVSSIDSDLSSQSHGLTLPVVAAAARTIEERLFREAYTRSWIVALAPTGDQGAPLFAVDRDHRIVGADTRARAEFGLKQERLVRGLSLWDLFNANPSLFRRQGAGADRVVGLRDKRGSGLRCALVSAPVRSVRWHISADDAEFLMRPRGTLLTELERHFAVQPPRGGLSAGSLRRVCEFVESHLEEDINLETLAAEARLSVYHFARAFKLSTGISPHRYVLEQRVKRARQLLEQTDLPLSAIASAVGFFDQGHFSRQFRSLVGTTPSSFRRTHRR
jgi:transcriptional regulator of acetoin/glycerol metabolism